MISGVHIEHNIHNCVMCLKIIPINGRTASSYNPTKTCSPLCRRLLMQRQAAERAARQGGGKKDKPYIPTAMDNFLKKK